MQKKPNFAYFGSGFPLPLLAAGEVAPEFLSAAVYGVPDPAEWSSSFNQEGASLILIARWKKSLC